MTTSTPPPPPPRVPRPAPTEEAVPLLPPEATGPPWAALEVLGTPLLLVDRRAPRAPAGYRPEELVAEIAQLEGRVDVEETRDPEAAARAALDAGRRYVVIAGDDRSVTGAVAALAGDPPQAVLGLASGGRSDFARTFGLDLTARLLARRLLGDGQLVVDLGRVTCRTAPDGGEVSALFANLAQVGYGAEFARRAGRAPRLLGRVGRLLSAWGAIVATQPTPAEVALDADTRQVTLVDVVVANGQFFQGGMKVAPRALPDDGRFNVQLFLGDPGQVFAGTPRILRGEHLPDPQIAEYQTSGVTVTPEWPLPVEADGRHLGVTPARFDVVPKALRLKV